MFCCGFIMGYDDGEKWNLKDWLCFILSPIIVPFMLGKMLCKKLLKR